MASVPSLWFIRGSREPEVNTGFLTPLHMGLPTIGTEDDVSCLLFANDTPSKFDIVGIRKQLFLGFVELTTVRTE